MASEAHGHRGGDRPYRTQRSLLALASLTGALLRTVPAPAECVPRPGASTCLTSDSLWVMPGALHFASLPGTALPPRGSYNLGLVGTYQSRPIVLDVATPGRMTTTVPAVDHQVGATFVATFTIAERVAAYGAFPVTIFQDGGGGSHLTGQAAPGASGLRDPRLGAALELIHRTEPNTSFEAGRSEAARSSFGLTMLGDVQVPTGSAPAFGGERGFVFAPTIAADFQPMSRLLLAASIGARVRPAPQSFFAARQTTQGIVGLGAHVSLSRWLGLGLEARLLGGMSAQSDPTQSASGYGVVGEPQPAFGGDWLASVRGAFLDGRLAVLGSAGTTLPFTELVGIGRYRALLGVSFTPAAQSVAPRRGEAQAVPAANRAHASGPTSETAASDSADGATRAPAPTAADDGCAVVCRADSYSGLPSSDEVAIAPKLKPYLLGLRACLLSFGGDAIKPRVHIRFSEAGELLTLRPDVGGYEGSACVKTAASRVVPLAASRGTTVHCELACR